MKNIWNKNLTLVGCAATAAFLLTACASDLYTRGTGAYNKDVAEAATIQTHLIADPMTFPCPINVVAYRGHVVLSGNIDTTAQKERAEEIARNTAGPGRVEDQLVVGFEAAGAKP